MPCSRRCGSLAQWCVLYANRYGAFSAYADAAMTAKHSIQTLMSRTSACRGRFDWRLAACPANTPAACYTWGCTPCSQSSFWGTVAIPGSPPRQHSDGTTDGAGSGSFPVAGACSSAVRVRGRTGTIAGTANKDWEGAASYGTEAKKQHKL